MKKASSAGRISDRKDCWGTLLNGVLAISCRRPTDRDQNRFASITDKKEGKEYRFNCEIKTDDFFFPTRPRCTPVTRTVLLPNPKLVLSSIKLFDFRAYGIRSGIHLTYAFAEVNGVLFETLA